jgi:hypothetical protein
MALAAVATATTGRVALESLLNNWFVDPAFISVPGVRIVLRRTRIVCQSGCCSRL